MYLKALELQGYKSFANKVEFVFDRGVTAVVGPNGSGKSNVADAIRWVLGEQSYRSLRGKKTEDMIFSGSDGRARLGMASATLILDNSDKWMPIDFSEVTISRRAYRSGENEYYLNGSRVRLKDVAELLARGGMSRQTYTVIGQGMIDRVLSLHAAERRLLFEEAAGIIFHRQKRADALDKLTSTQDNLLRLNDIVQEIEPQLRRLQKQAERAEEFALIKTHLEGLLKIWYGYRWGQSQRKLSDSSQLLHENEGILQEQRRQLQQMNLEIDTLRTEQTEARAQLSRWYSENNQLTKRAEAIQRELAVNEERANQYAAQREEILAELNPLKENVDAQTQHIHDAEAALAAITDELSQAEEALRTLQSQFEAHQAQRREVLARQNAAEAKVQKITTELTQRRTRLTQLGERRDTLLAEQQSRAEELARLQAQQQELEERQSQLTAKLTEFDGELLALETQQDQYREQQSRLNQTAEQLKNQMTTLSRREDALRARLDVLDKLRNDMSGYYSGVRAVMEPKAGLSGVIGPVGQIIQAPADLEVAIEVALGGRLQDVVVERFADAEAAIAHLRRTGQGRATLLPLNTIRSSAPLDVPNTPGVVGMASDLVSVPESRLRLVAEYALNRTLVVDDLPAARRAFEAMHGGFQIVTRDGELMRSGGSVTGGRTSKKQEGTFLAREREWRVLPEQIDALVSQQNDLSTQLADVHDQVAKTRQQLQDVAEQHKDQNRRRQEMHSIAEKVSRSLDQLSNSLRWQEELDAKSSAEIEQIDRRQADDEQSIADLEQAREDAVAEAEQLTEEAASMSSENLRSELTQAKADAAAIRARQTNQQTILDNHRSTQRQITVQIETKQARAKSLAAERETLLNHQSGLETQVGQFDDQLAQIGKHIQEGEKELADLEAKQVSVQQDERHLRQRLQRMEAEHNRLTLEGARRQDELDNLQRQIHEDLGLVQLEMSKDQVGQPILPMGADLPVVEVLPPGVEEDVTRLKVQVRRLGSINPEAPQEYGELLERHEFLTAQVKDLEAAVTNLREVISKLDLAMEEAFAETFEQVAKEFKNYFSMLFGGGEAQLILTDPDNMLETGVDIVARPPGKRLQSMALLSGGERSLTAQALIFSLLRISPTPFVIFDEVDAMLDEANVGRFRDALSRLADEIQFIVITHNRRTIESANTLYGVSMGDDSVSQVYSLKVDEWLEAKKAAKV